MYLVALVSAVVNHNYLLFLRQILENIRSRYRNKYTLLTFEYNRTLDKITSKYQVKLGGFIKQINKSILIVINVIH